MEKGIEEEVSAHRRHGTWNAQSKPIEQKPINCKWIFKKKITPGEPDRYKARLMARGFS